MGVTATVLVNVALRAGAEFSRRSAWECEIFDQDRMSWSWHWLIFVLASCLHNCKAHIVPPRRASCPAELRALPSDGVAVPRLFARQLVSSVAAMARSRLCWRGYLALSRLTLPLSLSSSTVAA